jgi:glycine oxidase
MDDVTIRGAGIFGLSIAWECARRGAKVTVVDPQGVAAGSSGGIVGALAPHVPENWNSKKAFQFDSLMMAELFWKQVEQIGGKSAGYARLGRVQPVVDSAALELAYARGQNAKTLWQGLASWSVTDTPPSWAPPSPTGFWIVDSLTARINPNAACHALAAALQAKGVQIARQADDRGVVLWATGLHDLLRISSQRARAFGTGVKGQAVLFDFDRSAAAQIFADTLHFVPHEDGTLAVGSTSEREYEGADTVDGQLDDLIEKAQRVLPELKSAPILKRWAGVRPRSRSRAPVLGAHPTENGAFIANGGFKIGFGMAPKIAQIMADLILEGRDAIPTEFRPEASF